MADRSIPNTQQVARAGRYFVAGELYRRGAYVVQFPGNMPKVDLSASDQDLKRTVSIHVKTKSERSQNWQCHTTDGRVRDRNTKDTRFWVLVDLKRPGEAPDYYVVPEGWIQNDIHTAHRAFLKSHGGERPRTPGSTHHALGLSRVVEWQDRWDVLEIFSEGPGVTAGA